MARSWLRMMARHATTHEGTPVHDCSLRITTIRARSARKTHLTCRDPVRHAHEALDPEQHLTAVPPSSRCSQQNLAEMVQQRAVRAKRASSRALHRTVRKPAAQLVGMACQVAHRSARSRVVVEKCPRPPWICTGGDAMFEALRNGPGGQTARATRVARGADPRVAPRESFDGES